MHQSLLFYFLFSHTGFKFPGNSPGSFPTILPSILLKAPLFDFADPFVSSFVAFPTSTVGAVNSVLSVNWPYTIFSSPRTTVNPILPCPVMFREE